MTHPGAGAHTAGSEVATHPWLGLRHVTAAVLVDMPPLTRAATAWVELYAPDEAAAHQALLNGIVYRHRDHHVRTCACQTCVSRRTALRLAFPRAAAAVEQTGAFLAPDERYGPGVVFPEGGSTHVVCCTCSFCGAQRRAAVGEALGGTAADGVARHAPRDPGPDFDAVCGGRPTAGTRTGGDSGGEAGGRSREKKKTTPRAADTAQVTVCADGGFVVGLTRPHRHLHGCKCPNCNRFRVAMLGSVPVVRLSEAQSLEVALAPAFCDFMAAPAPGDVDAGPGEAAGPAVDPLVVKEAIRRARIGASNSGRLPWNAGRQHSQETKAKIAERTRAALLDPAVRARIGAVSRPHTVETKAAISVGIARYLARRRGAALAVLEETLRVAVETAIQIAARSLPGTTWWALPLALSDTITPPRPVSARAATALGGPASAGAMKPKLQLPIEGPPLRNGAIRKRPFRAKSEEHKQRLASAMRARWADPTYAGRTRENMRAAWFKRVQETGGAVVVAQPRPAKVKVTAPVKRPAKAVAAAVVVAAGDGDASPAPEVAPPKPPPRSRSSKRELTGVQREFLAAQAHAMLAQAEAAAQALEAAAAGGAPVDGAILAEVHAAVATAQDILNRVALAGASNRHSGPAAPVAEAVPEAPQEPVVYAAPEVEAQEEAAPRAPPTKVWLRGRLVPADQAARAER